MARGEGLAAGKRAGSRAGACCFDDVPDDVLHSILAHLPLKEAVRAGVLARRWRNASAQVRDAASPSLDESALGRDVPTRARLEVEAAADPAHPDDRTAGRNLSTCFGLEGDDAAADPAHLGDRTAGRNLSIGFGLVGDAAAAAAADPARLHDRTEGHDISTGFGLEDDAAAVASTGVAGSACHSNCSARDVKAYAGKADRLSSLSDNTLVTILTDLPEDEAKRTALLSKRWRYLWRLTPRLVFEDDPAGVGEGVDRLSDLPDDVLLRILSRIPSIDAIQSCVLGRRWRALWTSLPRLRFDDVTAAAAGIVSFVGLVDGALGGHDPNVNLVGLLIRVMYPANLIAANLTAWAAFAAVRVSGSFSLQLNVGDVELDEVLVLELPGYAKAKGISLSVTIPEDIEVRMLLDGPDKFLYLSRLTLHGTRFTDNGSSISHVVSFYSPRLTVLDMHDVRGVQKLKFRTESLTKLVLSHVSVEWLEVDAPNLLEVDIRVSIMALEGKAVTISAPNLQTVLWKDICPENAFFGKTNLKKLQAHYFNLPEGVISLQNLFECFPRVENLEICTTAKKKVVDFEKMLQLLKLPAYTSLNMKLYRP